MTFVIPPEEKAAYYANVHERATQVIKATHALITAALAQGCTLAPVTAQQRNDYRALARTAKYCLTFPDGTVYFGETTFAVGRFLNEHWKPEGVTEQ